MKATLTLDRDIANYLRERCSEDDKPFEQVVNETLRRGMALGAAQQDDRAEFKAVPRSGGFAPGVDPNKLNQFLDELFIEEYFEKERRMEEQMSGEAAPGEAAQ